MGISKSELVSMMEEEELKDALLAGKCLARVVVAAHAVPCAEAGALRLAIRGQCSPTSRTSRGP